MNMSRFSKIITFAAAMTALVSCGSNARIEGTVSDAASSEVIVKLLNSNRYEILDTVKTNAAGQFSYKVSVAEGQPEFVYLFHKDRKLATLLLEAGDKVAVSADTLGNATIEGSEESVKLAEVEKKYASVIRDFEALAAKMNAASTQKEFDAYANEMSQAYVAYYREMVRYVLGNSHSMTVIPVFYQVLGENLPLFSQQTDAILYSNVADSLETVYPESKYVKALRAEAKRRHDYMELATRISTADQVDFLDIELPDLQAQKVKLSDTHKKVTLVYFWTATDAAQKMFNLDVLAPVYKELHGQGFEIYQVSLDADKGLWAKVAKEQNLPWANVCDSRGAASNYVGLYNIAKLPSAFIIGADGLAATSFSDAASLSKAVKAALAKK